MKGSGLFVAVLLGAAFLALSAERATAAVMPLPDKVKCVVDDVQASQVPDCVRLSGWVGSRIAGNEANRLAKLDPARLLEGYRHRPSKQSWDGEHVGKWLHAATLAWVNTGDPALREKMDYVAAELCKCQLADGYLGTYLDEKRWTSWDVWAHKYNLIGLVTYMRYTGNLEPLPTCRRMADLLCTTFGDEPGKRDIIIAGEHAGLAPTSVLEPMVLLYRLTGEQRYLEFCKYILRAWEHPNGPHVISTLLTVKRVDKVGDAKAYEMLSCLNGALEYYRTVGDKQILEACLNAWQDIVDKRLYITGAASYREVFHDDYDLPETNSVGETCVTVTWLQFNAHLLRLTGEARFAEQLERVVLNQLLGAQQPDCTAWGYYVQMEGKKPYSANLSGHCCLSSGPRGVALIPTFAVTTDREGIVVNLYDAATAKLALQDHTPVSITIETLYPAEGDVRIAVNPAAAKAFSLKLRIPAWSSNAVVQVNGQETTPVRGPDGYSTIARTWTAGDKVELKLKLEPRVIVGEHKQAGKVAVMYGPLVLAADAGLLPEQAKNLSMVAAAGTDLASLQIKQTAAPVNLRTWPGARVFHLKAVSRLDKSQATFEIQLLPFGDAGGAGSRYKVWLPLPGVVTGNLLFGGTESRSRQGNLSGSITDDAPGLVCTFDHKPATEDWYAVSLGAPVSIRRVVFMHGRNFHDGGWFDASAGKPRIEVQKTAGGPWETLGQLNDYPATTAEEPKKLKPGQSFTLQLPAPTQICGIRVVGKPASGDSPKQAFSSCAALQAYAD